MSASAWDKAIFAAPPRILGRQLHPFSLAHSRALKALGSPYMAGGIVTHADVLVAVSVCSRTRAEIARDVFNAARKPWSSAWALWCGIRHRWNLSTAHASLSAYFEDYADSPDHEDAVGGRKYQGPWEFHHARVLCDVFNADPLNVWDCPVVLARCLYDIDQEFKGDEGLLSGPLAEGYAMIAEANRLVELGRNAEAGELYAKAAPLVRKD